VKFATVGLGVEQGNPVERRATRGRDIKTLMGLRRAGGDNIHGGRNNLALRRAVNRRNGIPKKGLEGRTAKGSDQH